MQIAVLLTAGFLIRLVWIFYTGYTAEDAHITFQFARQLANGHGFVYNVGEPIYGTTTPLFTLLMAIWLFLSRSADVTFAAHAIDLLASIGSMLLLALTLKRLNTPFSGLLLAVGVLTFSSKTYLLELQGMETPVLTLLMMASWYTLVYNRPGWAGFFAGLLLWTRIDLLFWPVALILIALTLNFKDALKIAFVTTLTYLPWVVFARVYFGSPIPYTITAKLVMYGSIPLQTHLATVLKYLSPFAFNRQASSEPMLLSIGCIVLGFALWQTASFVKQSRFLMVLPVFATLEFARLVLSGSTFFSRYLFALMWIVLILASLGLVSLWQMLLSRWRLSIWMARGLLLVALLLIATQALYRARLSQFEQFYLNDGSLKMLGTWLNLHTAPDATVYLEPLGYVGYYADRKMLDAVGLVTPVIVDLRRKAVNPHEDLYILLPDYFIEHCDDSLVRSSEQSVDGKRFVDYYQMAAQFNPLNFDPKIPLDASSDISAITRNACYDLWQRVKD